MTQARTPESVWSDPATYEKIKSACNRVFRIQTDAEQCVDCVMEGLAEQDGRRIRAFKGQSRFSTFLYSVVHRLAADCHRKKYGRKRIPRPVARLGAWAEEIYRLVCWNKYSLADAYEICFAKGIIRASYPDFLKQTEALKPIKCPENPTSFSMDELREGQLASAADPGHDPQKNPLEHLLDKLDRNRRKIALAVIQKTAAQLSESDRFFINLVFGRDQSVAAAGKVLGLKDHQARRRLKKLLLRFRENLLAKGIREC